MNFIFLKKLMPILIGACCLLIFLYSINLVSAESLKDAFVGNRTHSKLDVAAEYAGYDIDGPGIESTISTVIQTALSLLGVIFLGLMVFGGYLWMTAQGKEEQVTKAKNLITAAIIGLIIVISSYAISYFVVKRLGEKTLTESSSVKTP